MPLIIAAMGIIDQIVGAESGGDANARNPNSSAAGAGQFLNSTWLETLAKHRPDLTGSPEELLALRSNPQLSREMTGALASDNAGLLSRAGVPVTPGSTYLAHFAGPGGAIGLLNADPSAPAETILGAKAVAANPFLRGKTAADVISWADRKMGGAAPMSIAGPGAAAPAPSAPVAPSQPASVQPPQTAAAAPAFAAPGTSIASLDALAAVPQLQNLLPPRPTIFGLKPAPFSFRG